jgi:hypothetical protein
MSISSESTLACTGGGVGSLAGGGGGGVGERARSTPAISKLSTLHGIGWGVTFAKKTYRSRYVDGE